MALDFPSSPSSGQVFNPGGGVLWQFDGTKWNSSAAGSATGALVYLGALQANNSAQLDYVFPPDYDAFLFQLVNVLPVNDGGTGTNYLQMLMQVGGAFQTTGYQSVLVGGYGSGAGGAGAFASEVDNSGINLSGYNSSFTGTGNAAGHGVSGEVWLHGVTNATNYKAATGSVRWRPNTASASTQCTATVGGQYNGNTNPVTGARFKMFGANNIASGQIRVYGLKTNSSPAGPQIMQLGGQLKYVSGTALSFAPYAGGYIQINGVVLPIPPTGVAGLANTSVYVNGIAAQNLAASTVYYVYAFMNAGVLTADFSTIAHVTSSTIGNAGTEIKNGEDARSLIGMIRTNASNQFVDSITQRFVLSWFNPAVLVATNSVAANKSTTSLTFVEWDATKRAEFLVWSNSVVTAELYGTAANSTAANNSLGIGFDGISAEPQQSFFTTSAALANFTISLALNRVGLAEGYHYATPLFAAAAGTVAVFGGTPSPTAPSPGTNVASGINVLVQSGLSAGVGVPSGTKILLSSQTISTPVASVAFTTGIDGTYDEYVIDFFNVRPASEAQLNLHISQDGGATWKTDASYQISGYLVGSIGSPAWIQNSAVGTMVAAFANISALTNAAASGLISFSRPTASEFHLFMIDSVNHSSSGSFSRHGGTGGYAGNTLAFNGLRFSANGGPNLISGTFSLFGIKR